MYISICNISLGLLLLIDLNFQLFHKLIFQIFFVVECIALLTPLKYWGCIFFNSRYKNWRDFENNSSALVIPLTLIANFSRMGRILLIPFFSTVKIRKAQLKFSHFKFCISAKVKPNSKIKSAINCPSD